MAKKASLKKVTGMMKDLDLCMFTTTNGRNMMSSRPMSNNSEVEYDGKSYFFTFAKAPIAKQIEKNPSVNLAFAGSKRFKKLFISLAGKAKVVKDREKMRDRWNKDLEIWFKDGIETPGIAMIEVDAKTIKFWHGFEEGEVNLAARKR